MAASPIRPSRVRLRLRDLRGPAGLGTAATGTPTRRGPTATGASRRRSRGDPPAATERVLRAEADQGDAVEQRSPTANSCRTACEAGVDGHGQSLPLPRAGRGAARRRRPNSAPKPPASVRASPPTATTLRLPRAPGAPSSTATDRPQIGPHRLTRPRRRDPQEHPAAPHGQRQQQAEHDRGRGAQHPQLAGVAVDLERRPLPVAGEGDRRAVVELGRLARRPAFAVATSFSAPRSICRWSMQ